MVNAYTFGLSESKNIVLYEPMLRIMNKGELAFVLGHEMGHVALGHTWLNTHCGRPGRFAFSFWFWVHFVPGFPALVARL
jgi:Zn-dependent protease with chaperone function